MRRQGARQKWFPEDEVVRQVVVGPRRPRGADLTFATRPQSGRRRGTDRRGLLTRRSKNMSRFLASISIQRSWVLEEGTCCGANSSLLCPLSSFKGAAASPPHSQSLCSRFPIDRGRHRGLQHRRQPRAAIRYGFHPRPGIGSTSRPTSLEWRRSVGTCLTFIRSRARI